MPRDSRAARLRPGGVQEVHPPGMGRRRRGWGSLDPGTGRLFGPVTEAMLSMARLRAGDKIVDVAAGSRRPRRGPAVERSVGRSDDVDVVRLRPLLALPGLEGNSLALL